MEAQQGTVSEQVAYLQGLLEGTQWHDPQENKILRGIVETLSLVAGNIEELREYVVQLDDDLTVMEDETGVARGPYVESSCPQCGEEVRFAESYLTMDGVEVTCPHCGGVVYATARDSSPQNQQTAMQ